MKNTFFLTFISFKRFPHAAFTLLFPSKQFSPRGQRRNEACEEESSNHYDVDVAVSIHNGTGASQFEILNMVSYLSQSSMVSN